MENHFTFESIVCVCADKLAGLWFLPQFNYLVFKCFFIKAGFGEKQSRISEQQTEKNEVLKIMNKCLARTFNENNNKKLMLFGNLLKL